MAKGKNTCKILKEIRRQIAEANDIEYVVEECQYKGDCLGTCPKCEAEVRYLEQQLHQRQMLGKAVVLAGVSVGMFTLSSCRNSNNPQGESVLVSSDTCIVENPIDSNVIKGKDIIQPAEGTEQVCLGGIKLDDSVKAVKKGEVDIPKMLNPDPDEVYDVVDQMPSYPGGYGKMLTYLKENVKYPKEAAKRKIQGRVIVDFVVNKDGSITDVNVVKPVHYLLDEEAVRVVKTMPKWNPGILDGKPVRVKYSLPITFRIPESLSAR